MKIRRLTEQDAQAVSELIITTIRISNVKDYPPELMEELVKTQTPEHVLERASWTHFYVAEEAGRIVGCGAIGPYWGKEDESSLFSIFVLPDCQGKGIGRAIVKALEQDEFALRARRIEIPASITGLPFYRKLGYDFKDGKNEVDEEQLYRLEKFRYGTMPENTEAVRKHYNADPQMEWDRLKTKHPYEKYITTRIMDRYIKPGDSILDIGGGPGHYAIHYAKQGHPVTLLDLSDENVRFARKKARQYGVRITALQGNALDLSGFADDSFDTVFLMGPMYHLLNEESRIRALREAKRVLKPGGYLFTSFILMFGGVIYGLRELQETILWPEEQPFYDVAANGESISLKAFTYAWMTTAEDAEKLLASVPGLRTETVFGQEGILAPYRNILAQSPKKVRQAWYDYALRFCEKREFLTHTEHLMIVSRKEA